MRLQLDARLGTKIMEYVWPGRRQRQRNNRQLSSEDRPASIDTPPPSRCSLDSPRGLLPPGSDRSNGPTSSLAPPALRRLGTSRSFTDLRLSAPETLRPTRLKRTRSISPSRANLDSDAAAPDQRTQVGNHRKAGDAIEMKTRSSQKSFVYVQISRYEIAMIQPIET